MHNDYSPLIPKRHNAYNVQYNIDLDTVQVDSEHKLQTIYFVASGGKMLNEECKIPV